MTAAAALVPVLDELDGLDEECEYRAGPPPGDGWTRVDALLRPDALDVQAGDLIRRRGDRAAAASLLSGWLAAGTAGAAGVALALTGRTWPVEATATWVRLHADGWVCGVAAAGPVRGGAPGDADAVGRRWAAEAAALLAPVIDHLAARLPFGRPGMWGGVADGVVGQAMWLASRRRLDPDRTWAAATRLVDHLAAVAPLPPARPRRVAVPWAGGVHHASVRSTCCLHYRTAGAGLDRDGDATCTSCPLRSDASRAARLAAWLDADPT
jgi:hypothetical protein